MFRKTHCVPKPCSPRAARISSVASVPIVTQKNGRLRQKGKAQKCRERGSEIDTANCEQNVSKEQANVVSDRSGSTGAEVKIMKDKGGFSVSRDRVGERVSINPLTNFVRATKELLYFSAVDEARTPLTLHDKHKS